MFKKLSVLMILSAFSVNAFAHAKHENEQPQEVVVKTQKVGGAVTMLQGRGGNVGVSSGTDGVLIIDDDFAQVAPKIAEALKQFGSDKPRFVLNTHWHGDHTGGNALFGKDSIIIAHTNVRKRMSVESIVRGNKVAPSPAVALPILTFDQSISIWFNGEEIRVVHFPTGHTDGDSMIFFTKSNVVHMGDTFFLGRFPFVDVDSGGSVQGLTKNIDEMMKQVSADVKIIPGHGPLATLDDLKTYRQMLDETVGIVQKGMMSGKTLEGLKKDGFPEKYKTWGSGFINQDVWIEIVFKSLSAKK